MRRTGKVRQGGLSTDEGGAANGCAHGGRGADGGAHGAVAEEGGGHDCVCVLLVLVVEWSVVGGAMGVYKKEKRAQVSISEQREESFKAHTSLPTIPTSSSRAADCTPKGRLERNIIGENKRTLSL